MFAIYSITNKINEEQYIGFTTEMPPSTRFSRHKNLSRNGAKTHLHCAMRKYGTDNFSFAILEMGENHLYGLDVAEPMYIEWLKPKYNHTFGGEGCRGLKYTPERLSKYKSPMLGKTHTEETRLLIREQRKKQIMWNVGLKTGPQTEQHKAKLRGRIPWNKGLAGDDRVKHTEETKKKMLGRSVWNKGRRQQCSP
jgi:group I intron endonuclease